jgi:hypothetical protein
MTDRPHVLEPARRYRLAVVPLIVAGVFFVLFPLLRPFFDESALAGATGFASFWWVLAHAFGMGGFILLSLGLLGIYFRLRQTRVERLAFVALLLAWIGTGLTLPFFGAEAFSLQVIGRTALDQGNAALLAMVNQVRFGPGILFVGSGLLLLAVASVFLATAIWKSGILPRWSGIPLAVGFVVYIPQLQGAPLFQPIRIVVGLVIAAGCAWIAAGMRQAARASRPAGTAVGEERSLLQSSEDHGEQQAG